MYSISSQTNFSAKHYLPITNGAEKEKHSHDYKIKIIFYGEKIKKQGYLIDLNKINQIKDFIKEEYNGKLLNNKNEFKEDYPTIENLANKIWKKINRNYSFDKAKELTIKVSEDDVGTASYSGELET